MYRKYYFLLFLGFFVQNMISQNHEALSPFQKKLYEFEEVQVKPEFIGGNKKFLEYISQNFDKQIKDSISVNFIVEMDGLITNIFINSHIDHKVGKKLKNIIQKLPKWLSGEHEGYHVRTKMNFTFNLQQ